MIFTLSVARFFILSHCLSQNIIIFVSFNVKGEQIMGNKIYPIGIQSFEKIRKNGYFYVDKTALIYRLV